MLRPVAHVFTHFELRLAIERADVDLETPAPPGHWWATKLSEEALPSVMKKAIEAAYPGATKAQWKAMTDIRHIVLDVGKVLVHYDPHQGYFELIPDPAERMAFLTEVCSSAWNIEQDRGRSWAEAEAEAIGRHPDKADLIRAFRKNWHLMVSHEYPESVALFRALLANGHDVTLLTNFASDTFREAQRRFPILKEGRGVTVSGDVKLIKPDPAIYAHHTRGVRSCSRGDALLRRFARERGRRRAPPAGTRSSSRTREQMREDLKRYGIAILSAETR